MKSLIIIVSIILSSSVSFAQQNTSIPDPNKKIQVVEVSCGECKFGMKGKSCDLAVRINGRSYFVDGTGIDSQGDAHAKDGFCKAIRKAEVQGEIVNGRFKVSYFKLLPSTDKNSKSKPAKA